MLPTITTWPSPERSSAGSKARVIFTVPRKFTSHIHLQLSSSASATWSRPRAPPALLTRTRTSGTCETNRRTDSLSVTSSGRARPPISPAIFSSRSRRLAPRTTSNPTPASARAVAAPIPADAPVTTAIPRSPTLRQLIQTVRGGTLGRHARTLGPGHPGPPRSLDAARRPRSPHPRLGCGGLDGDRWPHPVVGHRPYPLAHGRRRPLPGHGCHGRLRVEPGRTVADQVGNTEAAVRDDRVRGGARIDRPLALVARPGLHPSGTAPHHQLTAAHRERWRAVPAALPILEPAPAPGRRGGDHVDPRPRRERAPG